MARSGSRMTTGVVLQGVDEPETYRQMVRRIDELGFERLWMTDSSLHARDPFSYLTVASSVSTRLSLGTAVTNPVTRHPAIVATSIATVDEISGGRAVLGIGAGDRPLVALRERPARVAELADAIRAIRLLLAGEVVSQQSHAFGLHEAHMRFPGPREIPVFISASGERTLELAGAIADGVVLLCGLAPAAIEWALEQVDRGAASESRPRPHIALFAYGCIDDDEEVALAAAAPIAAWFPQTVPSYCELAGLDPAITQAVRDRYQGGEFQEAAAAASLLPTEFVRRMALAGSRERVAAQLREVRSLGVDSVNVFPLGDKRMDTVERFAECWVS